MFTKKTKFIFQPQSILVDFLIIYCMCSSLPYFFSIWQPVSSHFCRFQSLSHFPPHQNFDSYFLVFGKCGVTPHRLYRDLIAVTLKAVLRSSRPEDLMNEGLFLLTLHVALDYNFEQLILIYTCVLLFDVINQFFLVQLKK